MRELPLYPERPRLAVESVEGLDVDRGCTRCELSQGVQTVCMSPEVYGDPARGTVLVLGMWPGDQEDRTGRPNAGQSGGYLRRELARLWPGQVVFDNAVRCFSGSRKVAEGQISACRPYVARTFEEVRPDRVLCLGAAAVESTLGMSLPPMSVRRGYAFLASGAPVFFLPHPVMGLRNRFMRGWFESDLEWALSAAPEPAPLGGVALLVESADDAAEAVADLRLTPSVTFDLETFGVPFNSTFEVLNLAVAPEGADYAYVWDRDALCNRALREPVLALLESHPAGGLNVKFDAVCLRAAFGARVRDLAHDVELFRRVLDTEALARLEYQQALVGMAGGKVEAHGYVEAGVKELRRLVKPPKCGPAPVPELLACLSPEQLAHAKKQVAAGKEPRRFARFAYAAIPPEVRGVYNALDTVSTERLRAHHMRRFAERPDLWRVWDEVGRGMLRAVAEMEVNGIAVNLDAVRQLQAATAVEIADLEQKLALYTVNGKPLNVNSPKQVAELLYDVLKLPAPRGSRSTEAAVLTNLAHPVGKDIVALRKAKHFKAQYADGMEAQIRDDGRIHTNYQMMGTGTGRPSATEPNLLNIPTTRTPFGKLCRDIFVAPPGMLLCELDQSQIELRVAAMLSGDELMIDMFRSGIDFHLTTAKMVAGMVGVDPTTVTKEHPLRDQSKTTVFGALYGEPPEALCGKLGISKKLAVALNEAILGKFRRLKAWIQERLADSRRTGVARTWWNGGPFRERSLWLIGNAEESERETAERSSWNSPIQGTAADYTNASLDAVQRWIDDNFVPAKLVLTVYDSILAEVREDAVVEYALGAKRIMEGWPVLHGMPLVAEAKVGRAWGSMQKLELPA